MNTLSRGGLITVKEHCLRIFFKAEEEFKWATEVDHLRNINIGNISAKLIDDSDIVCSPSFLIIQVSSAQNKHLEKILQLYLHDRYFSFAKDVTKRGYVHKQKPK